MITLGPLSATVGSGDPASRTAILTDPAPVAFLTAVDETPVVTPVAKGSTDAPVPRRSSG